MTRKIFINTFLVGISVLLLCAVLFFGMQYRQTKDETYDELREEAAYAENGVMLSGKEYLETLDSDNRITWIASDGSVIFDSENGGEIKSQLSCPEVESAVKYGEGQCIRRSESGGYSTINFAVRCRDGSIIRLSRPISALRYAFITVSPVLWLFVLVLLISGIFAFKVAKQIVKPINAIKLENPDKSQTYPELAPLISRIQEQNLTISEQIEELHRKQKEFAALTDNMSEGFLLLDRKGTVLSSNKTALNLFPGCVVGENFFEASDEAGEEIKDVLSGKRSESILRRDAHSWQLITSPVTSHGSITGAVVLMMDISDREQREEMRKEFSANVSHELKTPLTSISGFAELMMHGLVSEDKIKEFSGDIYRESQRMIELVNDIIKLSKLDEERITPEWEDVDLYELCEDTFDSLRSSADKMNVSLSLCGEKTVIRGVWHLLNEMVYNLCDNAIKYNKKGGSVTVGISSEKDEIRLSVKDTGIGIPYAHQSRVFERFYRVDKSHSKEVGGTGLGLSIVKHGALYHNARIELESEPGAGTTVTLCFPVNIEHGFV